MNKGVVGALPKQNRFTRFLVERRRAIVEIISALFILLFVYTAMSKFWEFGLFKYVLGKSPLIASIAPFVAIVLPLSELIVSALLFIPRTRKFGLYSSLGLMLLFTGYLSYMIFFTPDRPCSCGGVLKQMTWTQHLIFNVFFTLLAWTGISLYKKNAQLNQAK